jgi:tetratricopeptide (TPR) repeat protein
MIINNVFITNSKYIPLFFKGWVTSIPGPNGMLRPLLMLTFLFNYTCGQLNPFSYHLINLLIHFLNCLLLYFLLNKLKPNSAQGLIFAITAIFATHPINTEAVTYISSRSDLLITFFLLSGLLMYLKKNFTLTAIIYCLSLLTKETGLCLSLLFFCCGLNEYKAKLFRNKKEISFFVLILLITLLYIVYKKTYFSGFTTATERGIWPNILIQNWVTFLYLKLFLWPTPLNFLHAFPQNPLLFTWQIFLPFLGMIGLISITVFLFICKKTIATLGFCLFLICLLPKYYATLRVPAAEHHFYMASIGLYILLFNALGNIYTKKIRYFWYITVSLIFICSVLTIERNAQMNDPLKIWQRGTISEPKHAGNWINLGTSIKNQNNLAEAKKIFLKASTLANSNKDWQAAIYLNLAEIYFTENNNTRAKHLLTQALNLKPKPYWIAQIYELFGIIYEKENNFDQSLVYRKKALQITPYSFHIYIDLAVLYLKQKDFSIALENLEKAQQINPNDFYVHYLYGEIAQKQNNLEAAEKFYRLSIELNPGWFQSHYALSLLYLNSANSLFAQELEETIRLNPRFEPALKLARQIIYNLK